MTRRKVKSVSQRKTNSSGDPNPKLKKPPLKREPDKPDWFDSNISNLINIPLSGNDKNYSSSDNNIGLGNTEFNNRYVKHNTFDDKSDCELVNTSVVNTEALDIKKLKTIYDKACSTVREKFKDQPKKIQTSIKTLTTKYDKKIANLNKVTVCEKYPIYPNQKQQTIIHDWFDECRKVYDFCIQKYNSDNSYFDKGYMVVKVAMFKELYGDDDKPAPYDILTDEIRIFCSNLKSCRTNLKNGNIDSFTMNSKSNKNGQCLFLPKTAMTKNGPYFSHLNKMSGMENIDHTKITNDCRLIYNRLHKSYTLLIPVNKEKTVVENRKKIVALDPGCKIFMAYYSPDDFGFLGYEFRELLLIELKKIGILQRLLAKGVNRNGSKIRNRNTLKRRIDMSYERMKNLRDELHHKVAIFLCTNYDTILIPEFATKRMVKTDPNYGAAKKRVNAAYEEGPEAGKEARRQYKRKKRLNKKDKFVLNMLSHYRFRQYLIHKANEYDCKVEIVTEEYTSQACTQCGHKSVNYDYRQKKCIHCGYEIDRDIGGSRNILIKNLSGYIKSDDSDSISDEDFIAEVKGWDDNEYVKEMFEYKISTNECDEECIEGMREYIENERSEGNLDNSYNFITKFLNDPTNKMILMEEVPEEDDEREYKVINNKVDRPLDKKTPERGRTSYRR